MMGARSDALAGRFPARGYSEAVLRAGSGEIRVAVAESFLARLLGLMLLRPREGDLPLAFDFGGGSASLHSAMMLYPIRVLYIGTAGERLAAVDLHPWRIAPTVRGCRWAIEAAPSSLRRAGLQEDKLGILTMERRMRRNEIEREQ